MGEKGDLRSKYIGKVKRKDGLKSSVVANQRRSYKLISCNVMVLHKVVSG